MFRVGQLWTELRRVRQSWVKTVGSVPAFPNHPGLATEAEEATPSNLHGLLPLPGEHFIVHSAGLNSYDTIKWLFMI
jgi:hypothetical protein